MFIFGSILKGKAEPGSDIDVLIISPRLKTSVKKAGCELKLKKDWPF